MLAFDDPQGNVYRRWANAFQGMHAMLSFTNVSGDRPDPGRTFASFLDGRWLEVVFGVPDAQVIPIMVLDSWLCMTMICQDAPCEAAVLYPAGRGIDVPKEFVDDRARDPEPLGRRKFVWLPNMC